MCNINSKVRNKTPVTQYSMLKIVKRKKIEKIRVVLNPYLSRVIVKVYFS